MVFKAWLPAQQHEHHLEIHSKCSFQAPSQQSGFHKPSKVMTAQAFHQVRRGRTASCLQGCPALLGMMQWFLQSLGQRGCEPHVVWGLSCGIPSWNPKDASRGDPRRESEQMAGALGGAAEPSLHTPSPGLQPAVLTGTGLPCTQQPFWGVHLTHQLLSRVSCQGFPPRNDSQRLPPGLWTILSRHQLSSQRSPSPSASPCIRSLGIMYSHFIEEKSGHRESPRLTHSTYKAMAEWGLEPRLPESLCRLPFRPQGPEPQLQTCCTPRHAHTPWK